MTEPQAAPEEEERPTTEADAQPEKADGSQAEIARLKDQLLRALAEAENVRRRAQKEREDTGKYAIANFAREMLTVADKFRRALESVPKEGSGNNDALKNLVTGVEAT